MSAGLPDVQGSIHPSESASEEPSVQFLMDSYPNADGAVYCAAMRSAYNIEQTGNLSDTVPADISFQASRSSSLYGASSTVQPPAMAVNFLIKA